MLGLKLSHVNKSKNDTWTKMIDILQMTSSNEIPQISSICIPKGPINKAH